MPKVSVVIPSFNNARYLPETIKSVLEQTFVDFEIVLVDDGSTDNTREIVAEIKKQYPKKIKYVYQENGGLCASRNTGIKSAEGKYIAILDSDDLYRTNMLEESVKAIESDSELGLVHSDMTRVYDDGRPPSVHKRKTSCLSGYIYKNIFLRKAHIYGNTVLVKKEALVSVGGYDMQLTRLGCEDRDLWLRIAERYKIGYIGKNLAIYRIHCASASHKTEKMVEGRLYVINKHCPGKGMNALLKRRALSVVHKEYGDILLNTHRYREASKQYITALFAWPFSIGAMINFVKARCYLTTI